LTGATAGFRPRRRWGQNFLVNRGAVERIVAAFDPDPRDHVLEIGPGRGVLTRRLVGRVARLTAVEIDPLLAAPLLAEFAHEIAAGTLVIVRSDILEVDLAALLSDARPAAGRGARVLANLPYNIASEVILRLLRSGAFLRDMMVMVQREVGARILAVPGGKTYGGLSVLCQACARVESVLRLRPGSFRPIPRVDSEVLRLTLRDPGGPGASNLDALANLLREAFSQRRKTLLKNLARGRGTTAAEALIRGAGLDPRMRPEEVPVEGYLALAAASRGTL
jgi:16S rRNA (adenine1518-N6/adenine1519-N6)-dimethyltransferase